MRKTLTPLILLLITACAPLGQPLAEVQLITQNYDLRGAAVHTLKTNGIAIIPDAPSRLRLQETIGEGVESVAADGSIGSRRINYQLVYWLDDGEQKAISRSEVIDYNADDYWASEERQKQAIEAIRADTLKQMIYQLEWE